MCDICGIWNGADPVAGRGRIDRMLGTVVHRGPDGEERVDRPGLAVRMRRLASIDLAGGDQPIFNDIVHRGPRPSPDPLRAQTPRWSS